MRKFIIGLLYMVIVLFVITSIFSIIVFDIDNYKCAKINTEIKKDDEKMSLSKQLDNIDIVKQDVSCCYATIEMMSKWEGGTVTEESIYSEYGKVVTKTGKSYLKELNKRMKNYTFTMYKYLENNEMLDNIYDSLEEGMPVVIEWASQYENKWTLHYSIVTALDFKNDNITVYNPYGYIENITIDNFIKRTTFQPFEKDTFYKYAFSLGVYERNTIFIARKNA